MRRVTRRARSLCWVLGAAWMWSERKEKGERRKENEEGGTERGRRNRKRNEEPKEERGTRRREEAEARVMVVPLLRLSSCFSSLLPLSSLSSFFSLSSFLSPSSFLFSPSSFLLPLFSLLSTQHAALSTASVSELRPAPRAATRTPPHGARARSGRAPPDGPAPPRPLPQDRVAAFRDRRRGARDRRHGTRSR